MFVTTGGHGVLVEGVRPGADPVRAAISATDAVDVLDSLKSGRTIDLPAINGVTGTRRLQVRPRPDGVEISIRSRAAVLGRWFVYADRVAELADALRRALTAARATNGMDTPNGIDTPNRSDTAVRGAADVLVGLGSAADAPRRATALSGHVAPAAETACGGRR
ncbi:MULTISPECIES: hypothetical protein [Actinoalloteichus]|uniref:Uncharacterized protein n=1 Tax=Actinoalloteichus fjordicus TaxID=1612552 RepID=A0AAC9LB98_9PSEU|nr:MULTISPECIES: hypothetical protein [Actinoalloteichus]APU13270.1 hypothetical protein UA74_05980 [Actinoalloteichus fjordicus]APU19221.1 hypothetical protein UA75_05985 [Actinoalloteichus sp. GBA129-24]